MEFASCSILRPQSFSSIFHYTNSHLYAFPKTHLNLGASPFSPAFPKDSTFPGKCLHFHRFTAFSSLSGADDRNPSQELAVLLEVDGVLIDAYRLGNRQTFNVAFKKLGLDCANWTEPVYVDLLRKCAGDEEKMLIMYFNRIGWPSSLPTTEKESFVKNVLQKKKIAMDEFLMSNSLPLRPGLEEFIDDAYSEGIPVVILTSYSKSGDAISRSIIEKLGNERILKLKIVGEKEVEQSLYGQLVLGKVYSSGGDDELAKEAMKAVSAEKQRIAEEVASMLKLNVDIDTTSSESLQKIIAALRAGAESAGLPVSNCVLIAGSQSGVASGAAEVVSCVSPKCGRFYHPHCVAILLNQDTGVPAKELERKIAGGESFTCPIHKCCICKQGENKKDMEFQFAVCIRCPKSYHRKCLPGEIAFENQGQMLEGRSITRAWDGLLPNRILIYCTKHDIDIESGTVRRDHIKFPDVKQNTSTLKKKIILEAKWKPISEFLVEGEKVVSKRNISLEKSHKGKNAATKKPYLQKKKTKKLMSGQKSVSKKSNFSPEESVGQTSDPVLSKLVKQKLYSVKEKTNIKEKTIVEEKEGQLTSMVSVDRDKAVSKRKLTSELIVDGDEGVSKKGSPLEESLSATASTVPKPKRKLTSAVKLGSNRNRDDKSSVTDISRMVKRNNLLKKELQTSVCEKIMTSLGEMPFFSMGSERVKFGNLDTPDATSVSQIHKEMPPRTECGDHGNQHPNPSKSCMYCAHANGRIHLNIPDDEGRRCTESNVKGCNRENSGKPYLNGMKQEKKTEFDLVPQPDLHFSRGSYLAGQNSVYDVRAFSSSFYSHIGPVADSLFSMKSLAMPSDATILVDPTAPQRGYLNRSMGFAPGPHLNYSLQNSAGWIDE